MSARQVPGLALDPRTKILIWLLANVVLFTWSPAVFRIGVMLAYFLLFLLERKGKMLASLLVTYFAILAIQYWLLPVLPGALATAFATVTYFILVFPCIAGGTYIIATTSVSQFMAALERMRVSRNFSITLAVTLRFLPALRQDFRHIWDAMALRRIRGLEQKLECVYVPMLMGVAQTAEELSESATSRGIEHPGKRSSWRPIGFHIQDAVVCLVFVGLCVGGICCKGAAMITFDHVTYTYEGRGRPSLFDCFFTVEPGELILLTGKSGCGKTTIIKLINGLLQHSGGGVLEGTVTVNGQEVSQVPLWELAQTVGSVWNSQENRTPMSKTLSGKRAISEASPFDQWWEIQFIGSVAPAAVVVGLDPVEYDLANLIPLHGGELEPVDQFLLQRCEKTLHARVVKAAMRAAHALPDGTEPGEHRPVLLAGVLAAVVGMQNQTFLVTIT